MLAWPLRPHWLYRPPAVIDMTPCPCSKDYALALLQPAVAFSDPCFDAFRADKDMALVAVRVQGEHLAFAAPELQDDEEVVLAALQNGGSHLRYASERLRNDRSVVMTALSQDPQALAFASEALRDDIATVVHALTHTSQAMVWASDRLRALCAQQPGQDPREVLQKAHGAAAAKPALQPAHAAGG